LMSSFLVMSLKPFLLITKNCRLSRRLDLSYRSYKVACPDILRRRLTNARGAARASTNPSIRRSSDKTGLCSRKTARLAARSNIISLGQNRYAVGLQKFSIIRRSASRQDR
jgi:hypothetical protein